MIIKCKCGGEVNASYQSATQANLGPKTVYQWTCQDCGQIYQKDVPEPIDLDEKDITADDEIIVEDNAPAPEEQANI